MVYPPAEPYRHGLLAVGDGHRLYYEECGSPEGLPAVYLHGGPGSGCGPLHRRLFDPGRFRAVLYDQRGAGRSLPAGALTENHSDALVADLERLRAHLAIERWLLCGGSWGATLALLYAQRHPRRVLGLVLRGTFLARRQDLAWYLGADGAARVFPEAYAALCEGLPQDAPIVALQRRLADPDPERQQRAALALAAWETALVSPTRPADDQSSPPAPQEALRRARILLHYAGNDFFVGPGGVLPTVDRLAGIPGEIIHGRCDLVCPVENAWTLHRHWPGSRLTVLPHAGHLVVEPAVSAAIGTALNRLAGALTG